MTKPELPLVEDPAAPRELCEALLAARAREPGQAELARLGASLGFGLPPSVPPPVVPAAPAKMGLLAKGAASLGAATLVTAALLRVTTPASETPRAPIVQPAPQAVPPSARPVEPSPAQERVAPEPAPAVRVVRPPREERSQAREEASSAPSAGPEPAPVATAPSQVEESDSASRLREEALLVRRAKSLLSSDPAGALRLTAERRREFPSGVLGQEASVIAIEALLRLGRRAEAEAQARAFEAAHPGSVHARRVRKLLEGE